MNQGLGQRQTLADPCYRYPAYRPSPAISVHHLYLGVYYNDCNSSAGVGTFHQSKVPPDCTLGVGNCIGGIYQLFKPSETVDRLVIFPLSEQLAVL